MTMHSSVAVNPPQGSNCPFGSKGLTRVGFSLVILLHIRVKVVDPAFATMFAEDFIVFLVDLALLFELMADLLPLDAELGGVGFGVQKLRIFFPWN